MNDEPKTLSVPEAAKRYFDIKSENTAYAAARNGDIPTIKIGGKRRVPVRALEQMLENPKKTTAA